MRAGIGDKTFRNPTRGRRTCSPGIPRSSGETSSQSISGATAKVLWLTLRLVGTQVTPTELTAETGFTHVTVRKGLAQLKDRGWHVPGIEARTPAQTGPQSALVSIPTGILADHRVRPQAKLIYGLLQTLPTFGRQSGAFTYTTLSEHTKFSTVTIRQVIGNLITTEWLEVTQANQKAPVRFTLCDPDMARRRREVDEAAHRLEQIEFKNEQIMKEYLSLLIDSDDYADNVRPGFLPNPESLEKLEIDRYYANSVGFEYNGVQHFRTTKRFSSERALSKRQFRDAVKQVLCEQRGVTLVIVTRRDLSLKGMQAKIGNLLPLRDLRGHEELIKYLEGDRSVIFSFKIPGGEPVSRCQSPKNRYRTRAKPVQSITRQPIGMQGRLSAPDFEREYHLFP